MTDTVLYAEDIETERPMRLGEYTVTQDDIVAFAERWDPQDFHTDPEAGRTGFFGGLIASGVQSIAILQRLTVLGLYDTWAVIAGKRMVDVRFLRPLRPGDTVTAVATVREVTVDRAKKRGLIAVDTVLEDAEERPVLSARVEVLVRARP